MFSILESYLSSLPFQKLYQKLQQNIKIFDIENISKINTCPVVLLYLKIGSKRYCFRY